MERLKNMREKEITVVVPVLNRCNLVVRTLDSIEAQSYRPLHLVIVDNNSTDTTLDVVNRWSESHRKPDFSVKVVSEDTPTASAARNRGLQEVETEYVAFFDSDDIMEVNHIARVMKHLESHGYPDMAYWDLRYRDADGWSEVKTSRHHDLISEHLIHSTLATIRFCMRTEQIRRIGGWNENLLNWDDLEFGLRILVQKPAFTYSYMPDNPTVIHTSDDLANSITSFRFSDNPEQIDMALDAIARILEGDRLHTFILNARRAILAADYRREGACELADKMLKSTLKGQSAACRRRLRLIYAVQLIFGCGASWLTLHLPEYNIG